MKTIFIASLMIVYCGCSLGPAGDLRIESWDPECRHRALLAWTLAHEQALPARLCLGHDSSGVLHVQAQAYMQDPLTPRQWVMVNILKKPHPKPTWSWQWIDFKNGSVGPSRKHNYEVDKIVSVDHALSAWFEIKRYR